MWERVREVESPCRTPTRENTRVQHTPAKNARHHTAENIPSSYTANGKGISTPPPRRRVNLKRTVQRKRRFTRDVRRFWPRRRASKHYQRHPQHDQRHGLSTIQHKIKTHKAKLLGPSSIPPIQQYSWPVRCTLDFGVCSVPCKFPECRVSVPSCTVDVYDCSSSVGSLVGL